MKGARKNEQIECIGLLSPTHLTLNGGLKYGFAAEVLLILTTTLPKVSDTQSRRHNTNIFGNRGNDFSLYCSKKLQMNGIGLRWICLEYIIYHRFVFTDINVIAYYSEIIVAGHSFDNLVRT